MNSYKPPFKKKASIVNPVPDKNLALPPAAAPKATNESVVNHVAIVTTCLRAVKDEIKLGVQCDDAKIAVFKRIGNLFITAKHSEKVQAAADLLCFLPYSFQVVYIALLYIT